MGIDWVATAIAVVAAGGAVWQAAEARVARNAAKRSEAKAAEHEQAALDAEQRMATASERTASATEGIDASGVRSADALERLVRAPVPWVLEELSADGHWRLRNRSNDIVVTTDIEVENPEDAKWPRTPGWEEPHGVSVWAADHWERVDNEGSGMFAGPGSLTLVVHWRWEVESESEQRVWKGIIR
jgi:hypothetical protein